MDIPFLAEIRFSPTRFIPEGWAWCDGQELSITQHPALFELLGTTYGGDGQSTFALPNLVGRKAVQVESHLVHLTPGNQSTDLSGPTVNTLPPYKLKPTYFCIALQGVFPLSSEGH